VLAGQFELRRQRRNAPVALDPTAEVAVVDGRVRLAGAVGRCRRAHVAVLPLASLSLVGLNPDGPFLQTCSRRPERFSKKETL
jgi:hypothetical protein